MNYGVAYLRDDFNGFVGWAFRHWCQLKVKEQLSISNLTQKSAEIGLENTIFRLAMPRASRFASTRHI
ncbi:hypothetical protein [Nostoc sp.]|uniref:hypothetical protein n=1 Tax=Nostoc sp. TaxID=1180 RepID=UPI002FF999A6